ncbi:MAG: carbon-nitrogen hydrolase family protein [Agarilytica sp.]
MRNDSGIESKNEREVSSDAVTTSSLRVASVQMISSDCAEANIAKAETYLEKASAERVDVLVLPENFVTYGQKHKPDFREQGEYVARMSELAKQYQTAIVAGSYPLSSKNIRDSTGELEDSKRFASSLVFDQQGALLAQYNKIHLFDALVNDSVRAYKESDEYIHGDQAVCFSLSSITCGVSICYDLRFPELFSQLAAAGAQVIFVPAAFTVPTGKAHWELLLCARAVETQCYIVAADQGGEHPRGRATWGHSMIISPWGDKMASMEMGEGMLCADLNMGELENIRRKMPVQSHRRLV